MNTTTIEWTEATWNPVTGCTKVSPGCDHCYAEKITERFHGPGSFTTVALHPERLDQPTRWRKPRRIFVNSMSDLFHASIPTEYLMQVWTVMASAPQHTFQILTKRAERMERVVPLAPWVVLPNVWLGVSVESPDYYSRIRHLQRTPAAVRFLSCEPLLAALPDLPLDGISWVIVGGESGSGARPMHPDWARGIRDQCQRAGVAFFFKQWGEWTPYRPEPKLFHPDRFLAIYRDGTTASFRDLVNEHIADGIALGTESHVAMYRVGKRRSGRILDGRTWDEYPVTTS